MVIHSMWWFIPCSHFSLTIVSPLWPFISIAIDHYLVVVIHQTVMVIWCNRPQRCYGHSSAVVPFAVIYDTVLPLAVVVVLQSLSIFWSFGFYPKVKKVGQNFWCSSFVAMYQPSIAMSKQTLTLKYHIMPNLADMTWDRLNQLFQYVRISIQFIR